MTSADTSPAAARVAAAVGEDVVGRLASLSGSDFTSLMLEVARRRAAAQTPASVLRRYQQDRFARPAAASWQALRRTEDVLVASLPASFEVLTLAPLAPLGAHSVVAGVSQDRVVTTLRAAEVAADATNALALEAAVRRRARPGAAAPPVRLAAVQRVVRAQRPAGGYLPHFGLFGLVTGGRDTGGRRFERESLAEHVRILTAGLTVSGFSFCQLALTPLSAAGEAIAAAVPALLSGTPVAVVTDRSREAGRGYYRELCFKLNLRTSGGWTEIADGGFTGWAAALTASASERLLISGLGTDLLTALRAAR